MSCKWNFRLIIALCTLLVIVGMWVFTNGQSLMEQHATYASSSNGPDKCVSNSSSNAPLQETIARTGAAWAVAASPFGAKLRAEFKPKDDLIILSNQLKVHAQKKREDKVVYLTFDDGPSICTKDILNICKKENVKATFFVLGQQVERHLDLVKRIVRGGHAIGNHSFNHNYPELYNNFRGFWHQIKRTGESIKKIIGYEPILVRAPGGTFLNFDRQYFDLMHQAGYFVCDWHVDSGDAKRRSVLAREIIQNVKNATLLPSIVVLMHDGVGHGETVKALPKIIRYYKTNGYSFARLSPNMKPVQFKVAPKMYRSRVSVSPAWIAANVRSIQTVSSEKPQLQQN